MVAPEDWVLKKLGDIAPLQRGFDLPARLIVEGEYPVVYSNGVLNYHNKSQARAPGVVTGRSGTIGQVTYIEHDYWPHNTTLWVTDFKENDPQFIYYLYSFLKLERFSTGSGVPTLNRNDVHAFEVLVPKNRKEQSAIVEVLADTDELIKLLDKLIEKKKNIKQGAMQELLSAKRRLDGFHQKWELRRLFEVFILASGKAKTNFLENDGKYIIMDMGSVSSEGKNISVKTTNRCEDLLECGDLVMPKDDIGGGNIIGKTVFIERNGKYVLGDHVYKLKAIDPATNSMFYSYLINSYSTNVELRKKAAGSAQLGLNRRDVENQDVITTTNPEEQSAIAQVFSDMDSEIDVLEQKRDKYKKLKTGMMQQLLTGRIRLKWKN